MPGSSSSSGDVPSVQPGFKVEDDHFLRGILFVEKAIFACPLPSKAGSSDVLGRATKTPEPWRHGLNLGDGILCLCSSSCQPGLTRFQDLQTTGGLWPGAQTTCQPQFCMDESGKNHVTGSVYLGLPGAVASGLQYPEAQCWLAREWAPCRHPRAKRDLDRLLMKNPSAQYPYSWMDNNCQHFAVNLYEGDHAHIV
eukprot:symbB.v1.2.007192.t1/scaffold436.1/size343649/24